MSTDIDLGFRDLDFLVLRWSGTFEACIVSKPLSEIAIIEKILSVLIQCQGSLNIYQSQMS